MATANIIITIQIVFEMISYILIKVIPFYAEKREESG